MTPPDFRVELVALAVAVRNVSDRMQRDPFALIDDFEALKRVDDALVAAERALACDAADRAVAAKPYRGFTQELADWWGEYSRHMRR